MDTKPVTPPIPNPIPNNWGVLLPYVRENKRRHYWIYSTLPNRGKTTFASYLVDLYQACFVGGERGFFDVEPTSKILIFDEFTTARITYTQINQMCDGTYKYSFFRRGNLPLDEKRPLLIILANRPIAEVYKSHTDTIYARFIEVCVDNALPQFDLWKTA